MLASTGEVLATNVVWARTHVDRARGLLMRSPIEAGEALVLDRARQVHTFGMRHPIDVLFCDSQWVVRHVVRSMQPMRLTRWVARGRYAIELPRGSVPEAAAAGMHVIVTP